MQKYTPMPLRPLQPNKFYGDVQPDSRRLKSTNNFLLVLVIVVNAYIISVPFMPQLLFQFQQHGGRQQELERSLLAPAPVATGPSATSLASPVTANQNNHVVIPAMLLDQPIVEGTNMYRALDQGVWRWPGGSTPDKGSNTVILGHRFTYTKPKGVFYFLDKIKVDDSVGIVWAGKKYVYRVTNTQVVHPNQTSILNPTDQPTLTMYTCTPLWLPKDRLVVTAVLTNGAAL